MRECFLRLRLLEHPRRKSVNADDDGGERFKSTARTTTGEERSINWSQTDLRSVFLFCFYGQKKARD